MFESIIYFTVGYWFAQLVFHSEEDKKFIKEHLLGLLFFISSLVSFFTGHWIIGIILLYFLFVEWFEFPTSQL